MNKEKFLLWWKRFIHWSGWTAWLKWKGWTAWLHWKLWKDIGSWPGWKKIFYIHPMLTLVLSLLSAAALGWVFLTGRDSSPVAYPIYVLSFYALLTLCLRLPGLVKSIHGKASSNLLVQRYLSDKEMKFKISLYLEQFINFLYGTFKTVSGILLGSAWVGADGLYNLMQGVIQLVQILRRRKNLTMLDQWKSYRLCGALVLVMHLTITGLVFQMTRMGRTEEYPGYLIFVTALFAFYKLISAFVDVAKDRKHKAPIDSSVLLLDLSQALFSLFSLQAAMIHQFEGSEDFAILMNSLTGGAVCLMVVGIGIYMLRRSRREIKNLEEKENG